MTLATDPICVQDPNLWPNLAAIGATGLLSVAATLVVVWLLLDAPTPPNMPRPSWRLRELWAIARHARAYGREKVAARAGTLPPAAPLEVDPSNDVTVRIEPVSGGQR